MNHIGALCEHDASSTCPRCEAELRASAHAEQEADRAQEAWERALHDWEQTAARLEDAEARHATLLREASELDAQEQQRIADEAAEQEASRARATEERWQRALSTTRTEVNRQARNNLILRLIAVAATAHLLSADWAAAWFVALAFAGGAALAAGRLLRALPRHHLQRKVIAETGAPFTPNRPIQGRGARALWVLVQLPAVGVAASALALLMSQNNAFHLYANDRALLVLSGIVHLAVIWATGFRRLPVENPFGLLPEDWTAVNAAYKRGAGSNLFLGGSMHNFLGRAWSAAQSKREAARIYPSQITRLKSELAALAGAAHLTPLPHAGLDALREQELRERRENADKRAAQLAEARAEVATVRQEQGRPLLDDIVSAMAGSAVPGSLGEWRDFPWYYTLPESKKGGFTTRLELFRKDPAYSLWPGHLPDGPHPTAEITDTQGERLVLVAAFGKQVHLGIRCTACGKHTISKDTVTDVASLLSAHQTLEHHCEPGAEAPQAPSPYSEI